ncbi:hypothetical protein MT418_003463 [Batrachochytrium dendrobatidis]
MGQSIHQTIVDIDNQENAAQSLLEYVNCRQDSNNNPKLLATISNTHSIHVQVMKRIFGFLTVLMFTILLLLWMTLLPCRSHLEPSQFSIGPYLHSKLAPLISNAHHFKPSVGVFPIMQGIQNLNIIDSFELLISGNVKTTLEVYMLNVTSDLASTSLPGFISFAFVVESFDQSLAEFVNISTIVHTGGTRVHIQTPNVAGPAEQIMLAVGLGLPRTLDQGSTLDLNVQISNGVINVSPINSTLAMGHVNFNLDVGAINTNGLFAKSLKMQTGAGAIHAVANITDHLHLESNSGYIQMDARFVSPLESNEPVRKASIIADDGWIQGSLSSYSTLHVQSRAGPITLDLEPLNISTTTSINDAGVTTLNFVGDYYGTFIAKTSLGKVSVTGEHVHFDPQPFPFPGFLSGYVGYEMTHNSTVVATASVGYIALGF